MTPEQTAREIADKLERGYIDIDANNNPYMFKIDATNIIAAALAEKEEEIERLRAALTKIADLDVDYPRAHIYRNDGLMSKFDKCPHDKMMYEGCESCVADFARAALKGET